MVALARVADNLIPVDHWPPAAIVQKLYRSNHARAFDDAAREIVERDLGYYCDLQSMHSEDAITWSYFGPIAGEPAATRASLLRWLARSVGMTGGDETCSISLWRRIPHPDTLVSGGPELDVLLVGDRNVLAIEAKWRSSEGLGQGKERNKGQMQLRKEFFETYGHKMFGERDFGVVGVAWRSEAPDWLTWEGLCGWEEHPRLAEYARYYDWKSLHSTPLR